MNTCGNPQGNIFLEKFQSREKLTYTRAWHACRKPYMHSAIMIELMCRTLPTKAGYYWQWLARVHVGTTFEKA